MYRPEIKVMDCTIRDGGLMNNWQFSDEFVREVMLSLSAAGVDYMEIGYKSSESAYSRDENGPWKFCDEEALRRIIQDHETEMKFSAMADIGRIEYEDIPAKGDSHLSMIRVACYIHQMDKAIALAEHCMDKGYEVTINLMAMSKVMERDFDEALNDLSKSRVPILYIVDSFGAMYCEQVESLVKKSIAALPGKTIGYHGHNNQQLAFSNTIEAIIHGANRLDGSLYGIGRGAGNCPIELLMSFLKNPKFDLRPVLRAIQTEMIPMTKKISWGYHIPYLITGTLNEHPRSAMKVMSSEKKDDFVAFYDQMTEVETLE
jgi:4-hydroxy 2-oxovalerate aldolase